MALGAPTQVHALGQIGSFRTQSTLSRVNFSARSKRAATAYDSHWSRRGSRPGLQRPLVRAARLPLPSYRAESFLQCFWRYVLHYPFAGRRRMRDASARFVRYARLRFISPHLLDRRRRQERPPSARFTPKSWCAPRMVRVSLHRSRPLVPALHGPKNRGHLLDVGRGKLKPDDIDRLYEQRSLKSGPTVPPQGLCMVSGRTRRGLPL